MINTIVSDMGGVLLKYEPEKYIAREGVTGDDAKLLMQEVFASKTWPLLDLGTILEPEAIEIFKSNLPERLHKYVEPLTCHWDEPLEEVPGMYDLISDLKDRGYNLYLLSNASTRQPAYWARSRFSELFDGTLISALVKMVKPNLEIYQELFKKFNLTPENCIYIDDIAKNAEGATKAGMHGIQFVGKDDLLKRLEELGL